MPVDEAQRYEERPGFLCGLRDVPFDTPSSSLRRIAHAKEEKIVQVHKDRVRMYTRVRKD